MRKHEKVLVELLHDHGLNVSYDRVLEISAQLGDAAVSRYRVEGVVCPPVLRRNKLFTTATMYNIDHNLASTMAFGFSNIQHQIKKKVRACLLVPCGRLLGKG